MDTPTSPETDDQTDIAWRWVIVGVVLILALDMTLTTVLDKPILKPLRDSKVLPAPVPELVYFLITGFGSFFVAGVIVAVLSPGETLTEPGIASLIAIGLSVTAHAFNSHRVPGAAGVLVVGAVGYAFGRLGGWLGERLQGDTAAKRDQRA